jgi:hypothetical protein
MPGLVPGIHVEPKGPAFVNGAPTWMAGTVAGHDELEAGAAR